MSTPSKELIYMRIDQIDIGLVFEIPFLKVKILSPIVKAVTITNDINNLKSKISVAYENGTVKIKNILIPYLKKLHEIYIPVSPKFEEEILDIIIASTS